MKLSLIATTFTELSSNLEEYTLIHIPFYYDDDDNMYNKTDYERDDDLQDKKYAFSCMYHGDENVEEVFWTVNYSNGTVIEFLNENGTEFHEVTQYSCQISAQFDYVYSHRRKLNIHFLCSINH